MQSRDFAFWLQGFFEFSKATKLDEHQTELIKKHLSLVFIHEIDPSFGDSNEKLNEAHFPVSTGDKLIRC